MKIENKSTAFYMLSFLNDVFASLPFMLNQNYDTIYIKESSFGNIVFNYKECDKNSDIKTNSAIILDVFQFNTVIKNGT